MSCTHSHDMLGAYALDALAEPDKKALEAHLPTCAECRTELARLREAASFLPYALPPAPPPPALKARLMERVAGEDQPVSLPARRDRSLPWRVAAVLATLGFLTALAWGLTLQIRLTAYEARMAGLEESLAARSEQLELLKARDVQMSALESQGATPDAVARFIWSPERRAWLVAISGLQPAETGKTYQLWAVTPDAKHSLGTFQTSEDGEVIVEGGAFVPPSSIAAAVSIEPEGGVPQPTGPIVMVGALAQ